MAMITLLRTPLTRKIDFDTLDRLGVNIYAPLFSKKTKHIIGWRVDAQPKQFPGSEKLNQQTKGI